MLPTSNGFPVKVILQYSSVDTPVPALMYDIHYTEEMPQATCYIPDSKSWITLNLAFVTPILNENNNKEKKVLVE